MAAVSTVNAFEQEREERIRQNQTRLAQLGILSQRSELEACGSKARRPVYRNNPKQAKVRQVPLRSSSRLSSSVPQYKGLEEDPCEHSSRTDGQLTAGSRAKADPEYQAFIQARRCEHQARGSIYDSFAGITCHFCRQKKLCAEPDCPRCSKRDPIKDCIGKSDCSRCGSATGRFCRACLLVRYGWRLEEVRQHMAAGTWLCPHCHEDSHPHDGWICNSSICMTRRGMKPTGIAIFDAKERGFASVAHHLQAQILARKGRKPAHPAAVVATSAPKEVAPAAAPAAEAECAAKPDASPAKAKPAAVLKAADEPATPSAIRPRARRLKAVSCSPAQARAMPPHRRQALIPQSKTHQGASRAGGDVRRSLRLA